jgi:hypothetical protein
MDKKKNIYQKSMNNHRCIGPCYYPKTNVIHPVNLDKYINLNYSTCPTRNYIVKNEITGKDESKSWDKCENPTHKEDIASVESLIILQSGFTKDFFLSNYYDINSFDDSIEWLNNNDYVFIDTKIRVINCALNVYGDNIDLFDEKFIDFFITYIKEKYITYIYKKIYKNIGSNNTDIFIINEKKNNLKYEELKIERINFIAEKFINKYKIRGFYQKFSMEKKYKFENYDDSLLLLLNLFIEYIKKDIYNNI